MTSLKRKALLKTMELFSTSAVSQETWDTQNFLCPWNQQEERCFGKSVFAPAFALDYTSPATQNALSYQSVTTNPPWKAHKKQSELFLEISPKGHWNSFLNHRGKTTLFYILLLFWVITKKELRSRIEATYKCWKWYRVWQWVSSTKEVAFI